VQRCVIDGLRSHHARSLSLSGIAVASEEIAAGLLAQGWRKWSARVRATLEKSSDDSVDAERLGEALETLRKFGPQRRPLGDRAGDDPLEVLVTSLGRYWLPKR
jgi:hypothetical protein